MCALTKTAVRESVMKRAVETFITICQNLRENMITSGTDGVPGYRDCMLTHDPRPTYSTKMQAKD